MQLKLFKPVLNGWHIVDGDPPKKDGRLLCWAERYIDPEIYIYDDGKWYEEIGIRQRAEEPLNEKNGDVIPTHYMPVPDKPEPIRG